MKRGIYRSGVVLATLGLLSAAFVAPASAGPLKAAVHGAGDGVTAAAFWTPEKMRSAIPMDRLLSSVKVKPADVPRAALPRRPRRAFRTAVARGPAAAR
jgi:hypothetical protein